MKEFKTIAQSCLYRNRTYCSYWNIETQCHFLSCPLFSREIPESERSALKKQIIDSVQFDIEDFERTSTSIHDLIEKVRNSASEQLIRKTEPKSSSVVEKEVKRMICFICEQSIIDDRFSTVRDPKGVILYFHSRGECIPRITNINGAREKWRKMHFSEN